MPTFAGGNVNSMQMFQGTEKENQNTCSNIFSSLDFHTGYIYIFNTSAEVGVSF